MFELYIKWNREFKYSLFKGNIDYIEEAKSLGESLSNSGDGARVKGYQVFDENGKLVYPENKQIDSDIYPKLYICDYCGKEELGKPLTWLKPPIRTDLDHRSSLSPKGWSSIYTQPCKNNNMLFSCGCHKFN